MRTLIYAGLMLSGGLVGAFTFLLFAYVSCTAVSGQGNLYLVFVLPGILVPLGGTLGTLVGYHLAKAWTQQKETPEPRREPPP